MLGCRSSLNDLIRSQQQRRRDREPERLGSLHVDHQLKPGGLLDGQGGWDRAFQNLGDDQSGLPPDPLEARPIRQEPSRLRMLLPLVDGGKPVARREVDDRLLQGREKWRGENIEGFRPAALRCLKYSGQVGAASDLQDLKLYRERSGGILCELLSSVVD